MKVYISAMATDKQSVAKQISDASGILIEHLIKLYIFPDSEYEQHWRQEVWNLFHRVPKLNNTKKFPPYNLIREAIGIYDDMIPELSYVVKDEYFAHTAGRSDIKECEEKIIQYLDWVSEKLSQSGTIVPSEVYKKLHELDL